MWADLAYEDVDYWYRGAARAAERWMEQEKGEEGLAEAIWAALSPSSEVTKRAGEGEGEG